MGPHINMGSVNDVADPRKKRDKNLEIKKLSNPFLAQKFLSKQKAFYGFDSEVFI